MRCRVIFIILLIMMNIFSILYLKSFYSEFDVLTWVSCGIIVFTIVYLPMISVILGSMKGTSTSRSTRLK